MAWIKRNLYFVITASVALGVTGYFGYLLFSSLGANTSASGDYASAKSSLEELQHKSPYPSPENIKAAEDDKARVQAFLTEFRKPFAVPPVDPPMDDREFTEYLRKSIARLGAAATNAGVGMQPDYDFAFSQQADKLNHPSESIPAWLQEIDEINVILHVLYSAKINYLEKIKRPPVSTDDAGGDDYIQFPTNTTPWGAVSPYVVYFRAFSAELANVLAGVASSSNCLIVKAVYVSPSHAPLPKETEPEPEPVPAMRYFAPPRITQPNPYANPFSPEPGRDRREFMDRSRMQRLIPQQQQPPPSAEPAAPAAPETILSETPLFVTLYIDVIRLNPLEKPAATTSAPGAGPGMHRPRRGPP